MTVLGLDPRGDVYALQERIGAQIANAAQVEVIVSRRPQRAGAGRTLTAKGKGGGFP